MRPAEFGRCLAAQNVSFTTDKNYWLEPGTDLLDAATSFGQTYINEGSGSPVTDRPIDVQALGEPHTPATLFANFLNALHKGMSHAGASAHHIPSHFYSISACNDAERHFATTLARLDDGRPTGVRIFANASRQPYLLQKAHGEDSALVLNPIAITRFIVPPGSILGLTTHFSELLDGEPAEGRVVAYRGLAIKEVSFVRFSEFALAPSVRDRSDKTWGTRLNRTEKTLAHTLAPQTLGAFVQATMQKRDIRVRSFKEFRDSALRPVPKPANAIPKTP